MALGFEFELDTELLEDTLLGAVVVDMLEHIMLVVEHIVTLVIDKSEDIMVKAGVSKQFSMRELGIFHLDPALKDKIHFSIPLAHMVLLVILLIHIGYLIL